MQRIYGYKMFIGGLPSDTTKAELEQALDNLKIDAKVRIEKKRQLCAGFGYIYVKDMQDSQKLLDQKLRFKDRLLDVEIAKNQKSGPGNHQLNHNSNRLYVYNISRESSDSDLCNVFRDFQGFQKAYVIKQFGTEECMGFGYLYFEHQDSAFFALERSLSETVRLHGHTLKLKPYLDKYKAGNMKDIHDEYEPKAVPVEIGSSGGYKETIESKEKNRSKPNHSDYTTNFKSVDGEIYREAFRSPVHENNEKDRSTFISRFKCKPLASVAMMPWEKKSRLDFNSSQSHTTSKITREVLHRNLDHSTANIRLALLPNTAGLRESILFQVGSAGDNRKVFGEEHKQSIGQTQSHAEVNTKRQVTAQPPIHFGSWQSSS